MWFYKYYVCYYDLLENCQQQDFGIVCQPDYRSAMEVITAMYGDDELLDVRIQQFGEDQMILCGHDIRELKINAQTPDEWFS